MEREAFASPPNIILAILALLVAYLLAFPGTSTADTYDGLTPAEEQICEPLAGAAFGLCNAYCEAIDCDSRTQSLRACDSLRTNYFELTGESAFPCDFTCPEVMDEACSGNGELGQGADSCDVCLCDENWEGSDCATCAVGFDSCGVCGGDDSTCGD